LVRETACEETGAIWRNQAGGREENNIPMNTDGPFRVILWERFV